MTRKMREKRSGGHRIRVVVQRQRKKQMGGGYFEFIVPRAQELVRARNKMKMDPKSVEHRGEWRGETLNQFPHRRPKRLRSWQKTIHYFQVKHVIENPKKNIEAEKNSMKAELEFMIDLINANNKPSRLISNWYIWRYVWKTNRKKKPLKNSRVFNEIIERFGLLFAGYKIVIPEKLTKQVVDALHFGQPGTTEC